MTPRRIQRIYGGSTKKTKLLESGDQTIITIEFGLQKTVRKTDVPGATKAEKRN